MAKHASDLSRIIHALLQDQAGPVTLDLATDRLITPRAEGESRSDRLEAFLETLEDDDDPEPRDRP
ncbi:hypothetical protein [Pseudotabrizicola formosa]|uniref:hypothetical protein n=1 Tax=Pseudotabrizicola formosa TaxID=2030009 RepID=UPI000CCFF928|nr:hypothetical protein [Pseudotabrizicola formosa]